MEPRRHLRPFNVRPAHADTADMPLAATGPCLISARCRPRSVHPAMSDPHPFGPFYRRRSESLNCESGRDGLETGIRPFSHLF
jgi:hypothetical protein